MEMYAFRPKNLFPSRQLKGFTTQNARVLYKMLIRNRVDSTKRTFSAEYWLALTDLHV